jgi:hypothetical protein
MSWVLKQSPVDDPQARLILLVLADCANEDGGNAFPKRETIAAEARVPVGTVGRKLADLRAAGHIEETGRTGYNNRTVVWRVVMGAAIQSERSDSISRQSDHGRSDQSDQRRSDSRVEASVEPSEPPVLTSDGSGRGRAVEAWPQILDCLRRRPDITDYIVYAWLSPLTPLDLTGGRLVLGAPAHSRSWVREHGFLPLLELAAAEVVGQRAEVSLMPMVGEAAAA